MLAQVAVTRSVALIFLALFVGCQPYVIRHDPTAAGTVALAFAQTAFVNQDFEDALRFLPKNLNASFTSDSLKRMVVYTHTNIDFPKSVKLSAYEIVPSQRAVNVYLIGFSSSGTKHHYHIILSGDASSGYAVLEMYGSPDEFPASSLRRSF
jgi:hypothetical protein